MTDEARGLLLVAALLSGGSFVGGRVTAPVPPPPPPEVRYVLIPAPASQAPPAEAAPVEPAVEAPALPAPVDAKPIPASRPKIEAQAKVQIKPARVRIPSARKSRLPSCAFIRREYEAMTMAQRWAAYRRATPEQIAHGKRCLGM